MELVEEAVDGCWIGHRARTVTVIGSVYSPPTEDSDSGSTYPPEHLVETVVDVGFRQGVWSPRSISPHHLMNQQGWVLKCEKGGIRRILMNVFGNSLKFTTVCPYCSHVTGLILARMVLSMYPFV